MAEGLETLTSLGRTVFQNNRIGEICPEKPVPTTIFRASPCQRSYACSIANVCKPFAKSGRTVFWD